MSVSQSQIKLIQSELRHIEAKESVTILWACESGSRAWGFESTDSDYDVRFIYIRNKNDYLRVSSLRDVIEVPISDELDISGWDLTKSLELLRKSNPPLLEWLQSSIVYQSFPGFKESFWNLAQDYFCPRSCMYHYMSMADRNRRSYLETDTIRLKRYFYMLRPLLACQWLQEREGIAPMRFDNLLDELLPEGQTREIIDQLIVRKRSGVELGEAPTIPQLSSFINSKMNSFESIVKGTIFTKPWERLDDYFRSTLDSVELKKRAQD
ncbi:MAG: nucleotidyltransferase domain-containing protein [Akkermansiaceae bacterium]